MNLLAFLSALLLQTTHADELPYVPGASSPVEEHINQAYSHMISAQSYICADLRGRPGGTTPRRQYDAVDRRYFSVVRAAEARLQRRLNLEVWVNSCRRRDPGREFRRHMRAANASLKAAEQLLEEGQAS